MHFLQTSWIRIKNWCSQNRTLVLVLLAAGAGLALGAAIFSPKQQAAPKKLASQTQNKAKAKKQASADYPEDIYYSDVLHLMQQKRVQSALIDPGKAKIQLQAKGHDLPLQAELPPGTSSKLSEDLSRSGANVAIQPLASPESNRRNFFENVPPMLFISSKPINGMAVFSSCLLLGMIIMFIMWIVQGYRGRGARTGSRMAGGEIGAIREDVQVGETPQTRFDQVAGCDEVVEELEEFVEFLRDAEHYHRVGAKIPSGVVLHGPPGTGKTLLARALAGESGVDFFAVSGSEFVEKYVGVGASRVRELFEQARKCENGAVVFIDEIDAIGRTRSGENDAGNRESDQTLNELLTQLDGFHQRDRIIVVAATNRLDVLDPALLRPGRLSRHIPVDLPAEKGRLEILRLHVKDRPLAQDVDLAECAKITGGMSGAELEDMLNEAAIMAARERRTEIAQADLIEGQLRSIAGPVKKDNHISKEELQVVAHHEAGHVLTAELCREHEKAQRASIRPRGRAGGLAMYGQNDRALHSPQFLFEQLVCLLGGRAAEWVCYGSVSSGAANDLQRATRLARQAVQELGFAPGVGQVSVAHSGRVSDRTQEILDREVESMVAQAYGEAVRLLEANQKVLESLAAHLLEEQDIDRSQIALAVNGNGKALEPQVRSVSAQGPDLVPVLHQQS